MRAISTYTICLGLAVVLTAANAWGQAGITPSEQAPRLPSEGIPPASPEATPRPGVTPSPGVMPGPEVVSPGVGGPAYIRPSGPPVYSGSLSTGAGRNMPPLPRFSGRAGPGTRLGQGATASTGGGIGGGMPITAPLGMGVGPGATPGVGGVPGPGAPLGGIAGRAATGGLSSGAGVGAGVGGSSTGPGGMLGSGISGSTGTQTGTGIGVNAGFGPGGSTGPTPGPGGAAITGPGAAGGTAYGGSNVAGAAAAGGATGTPVNSAYDVQPSALTMQPGPVMGVRSGNMIFEGAGGAGAADNGGATNLPRNTPDARDAASIGLAMNVLPGAVVSRGGVTGGAAGSSVTPSDIRSRDLDVRYRWLDGRWWYLMPDNRWVYYDNGRWVAPSPAEVAAGPIPYSAAYRSPTALDAYYGTRTYFAPGFYTAPGYSYRPGYTEPRTSFGTHGHAISSGF